MGHLHCYDAATGEVLWTHSYPGTLVNNLHEGGPSATPTVDGQFVYTLQDLITEFSESEIRNIAGYFAGLPPVPPQAELPAGEALGRSRISVSSFTRVPPIVRSFMALFSPSVPHPGP